MKEILKTGTGNKTAENSLRQEMITKDNNSTVNRFNGIDLKSNHAFSPKLNLHSMASKEFPLQPNCSLPELHLGPISGQNRK